jgi:hypothetical protein
MRTILKVTVPVEAGNVGIKNGRLAGVVESAIQALKPEATYFYAEGGKRHALFVFDLKDASDIPSVAEPFFLELNADVELHPCMNLADMRTGVAKATAAI